MTEKIVQDCNNMTTSIFKNFGQYLVRYIWLPLVLYIFLGWQQMFLWLGVLLCWWLIYAWNKKTIFVVLAGIGIMFLPIAQIFSEKAMIYAAEAIFIILAIYLIFDLLEIGNWKINLGTNDITEDSITKYAFYAMVIFLLILMPWSLYNFWQKNSQNTPIVNDSISLQASSNAQLNEDFEINVTNGADKNTIVTIKKPDGKLLSFEKNSLKKENKIKIFAEVLDQKGSYEIFATDSEQSAKLNFNIS